MGQQSRAVENSFSGLSEAIQLVCVSVYLGDFLFVGQDDWSSCAALSSYFWVISR